MFKRTVRIRNRTGLHARPAALLVETANRFRSSISVTGNEQEADSKSVLALMLLEAVGGTDLTVKAEGEDEIAAVNALVDLIERDFDENP